ncbi:MAG: Rrf2 family transcriptional regulator [Calditrichota bacterium]
MIRFSRKVEYSLIALMHIAERNGNDLTTAKELSINFNMPQEVVGKVLQKLARAGVITSVQGAKGGYFLEKNPEDIKLTEIVRTIEGPIELVGCITDSEKVCTCGQLNNCNIRKPMEKIQNQLRLFFDMISLEHLLRNDFPLNERILQKNVADTLQN